MDIPYTDLCALAEKYGTDKRPEPSGHGYTHYYHSLFADRRERVKRVLELGIDVGASLFMWEEYFPNARIFALDCDERKLIMRGRIQSYFADCGYDVSLQAAMSSLGTDFDFIVDDASHEPPKQITAFEHLFPLLRPGGIYVIEDVLDPARIVPDLPPCEVVEFLVSRDPYSKLVVIRA